MNTQTTALQNLKLLRFQFFFWGWLPENIILIIYFGELLGSYTLCGIIFMLRYFAISLFEIPTGIVSDKHERRNSLILSSACYSLVKISYILAFFFNPLFFLLLSSILYGLAESLSSGTNDAIVYENVKILKQNNKFEDYYGKIKACHILGLAVSSLIGGIVTYFFSLFAVMVLSLAGTFLQLYYSWKLKEIDFIPVEKKKYLSHFFSACSYIWHNNKLRTLFAAIIFNSGGSRGHADMLPLYLETFIPFWLMGVWRFAGRIINFFSSWFVSCVIDKFGFQKSCFWTVILTPASIFFGLVLNNILTPIIFLGDFIFHGIKYTCITKLKQNEFTDTQRATMESICSMISNIFDGLAVLLVSIVAEHTSAYWATFAALLFKLTAVPFYLKAIKNENIYLD